jgi:hypothetical protein
MAASSPDGRESADALVAAGSASDVEGDDGEQIVFSSVPVVADRQSRQLRGVLHRLAATPYTEFAILSDGADGPRSRGEAASIYF